MPRRPGLLSHRYTCVLVFTLLLVVTGWFLIWRKPSILEGYVNKKQVSSTKKVGKKSQKKVGKKTSKGKGTPVSGEWALFDQRLKRLPALYSKLPANYLQTIKNAPNMRQRFDKLTKFVAGDPTEENIERYAVVYHGLLRVAAGLNWGEVPRNPKAAVLKCPVPNQWGYQIGQQEWATRLGRLRNSGYKFLAYLKTNDKMLWADIMCGWNGTLKRNSDPNSLASIGVIADQLGCIVISDKAIFVESQPGESALAILLHEFAHAVTNRHLYEEDVHGPKWKKTFERLLYHATEGLGWKIRFGKGGYNDVANLNCPKCIITG